VFVTFQVRFVLVLVALAVACAAVGLVRGQDDMVGRTATTLAIVCGALGLAGLVQVARVAWRGRV
jgi:hypothetical protein